MWNEMDRKVCKNCGGKLYVIIDDLGWIFLECKDCDLVTNTHMSERCIYFEGGTCSFEGYGECVGNSCKNTKPFSFQSEIDKLDNQFTTWKDEVKKK